MLGSLSLKLQALYWKKIVHIWVSFWSVFSRIRTKCRSKSPYSVQTRENTEQKNSKYGHFFTQCRMPLWLQILLSDRCLGVSVHCLILHNVRKSLELRQIFSQMSGDSGSIRKIWRPATILWRTKTLLPLHIILQAGQSLLILFN